MISADGGGGLFFGYQTNSYPLLDEIANNSLGLAYYGGFGYGVGSNQGIVGGFGMAIMDIDNETGIAGGFGGIVSGLRIVSRPINVSILSLTGFGGISAGFEPAGEYGGFFAISQELSLELGIPILPWFMPTLYVGYQVVGSIIPGIPFGGFFSYTPVVGIRMQWGDFY